MDDPLLAAAAPPPPPRPSFAARRSRCCCFASGLCAGALSVAAVAAACMAIILPLLASDPAPPPPSLRPPDAPSNLRSTAGVSAAHLTWDAPSLHGRAFVRYAVLTNRSGGGGELQPDAACAAAALPSCTLAPLGPSEAVLVRVAAVSTDGAGNASELVVARALPPQRPAAPTALAAEYSGADFVCAAWAPPPPAAAPPRYEVQVADATTSQVADGDCGAPLNWSAPAPTGEAATASLRHVVGLAAERAYCVRVRAANDVGASAWSEPIAVRTSAANATSPSRPPPPEVVDATADAVELRWRPPADDGGSPVQGYRVELHRAGDADGADGGGVAACETAAHNLSCTLGGLEASAAYDCRVAARNSRGQSAWSPNATAHTSAAGAPGAPGTPSELAGSPLVVAWAAAEARGSAVVEYSLELDDWWNATGGAPSPWRTAHRGGATQADLTGMSSTAGGRLLPASTYRMRARARNAVGWGAWSAVGELHTAAGGGGCADASDLAIFHDNRSTVKAAIQAALTSCILSKDRRGCAAAKMVSDIGLTAPCAGCWADEGLCTVGHCLLPCANPTSAACAACSEAHCFPACVACSGLPRWAFPP